MLSIYPNEINVFSLVILFW